MTYDTRRHRHRESIEDARSFHLKGVPKLEGSITMLEYRYGMLTVQYRSGLGQLDVWFTRKVLSIERFAGKPQLIHYIPGHWEHHLIGVAKVAA